MIRLQGFSAFQRAATHCKQNNPQTVNKKYIDISASYHEFLTEFLASPQGVGETSTLRRQPWPSPPRPSHKV
jgi:hypothetical protein